MPAPRMAIVTLATSIAAACTSGGFLSRFTLAPSPRDQYADSLRAANLHLSGMGADWLRAGDEALARPIEVMLPFSESAYYPADRPAATAYRFELARGRRLDIDVRVDAVDGGRLFVDLFESRAADPPRRVASLDEGSAFTFEAPRDGQYLLRVQPELLRSGRYTITQRTRASLSFPVQGYTPAAVQSEFGAAREAGRRRHEGIDIFAPRNTPVVAVADGNASPGTNGLGGTVVWLRDSRARRSYYYAHLQRWAFEHDTAVAAGQVVGYVGNSGNARTTAPHLHFGIYQGGAIDPFPFIGPDDPVPPSPDTRRLSERVRVASSRAPLRRGADRDASLVAELTRDTVGTVVGATASYLRVILPDGSSGYLDHSAVALATPPLRQRRVQTPLPLRERPLPHAPVLTTVGEGSRLQVLGRFHTFELVRTPDGTEGWLSQ